MFLTTGPGSIVVGRRTLPIFWGPKFFLKGVFKKIFVAKIKKILVIMSQNYYIGYTFVYRKNSMIKLLSLSVSWLFQPSMYYNAFAVSLDLIYC